MSKGKVIEIVVARNDFYETYAPFSGDKEKDEEKVKRGMLTRIGMKPEEIDKVIDNIEIVTENGGLDGMFDDGPLTHIQLIRKVYERPPAIQISVPDQPKDIIVDDVGDNKRKVKKPRQTMLQQYYGDRKAERRRVKIFDRFKSHIVKKQIKAYSEDGTERIVEVYTIEDYAEKSQDSDELLLNGYQTRLERLSRAHQGDFSPYKRELQRLRTTAINEIMQKYEEMHTVNPEEAEKFKEEAVGYIDSTFKESIFERKAIQALIDQDTEFIETNNYTYNSRQNTAENLKTMGKDGEKSVKAQISDDQSKLQKLGLKALNFFIGVRNYTTVPINKALGTYVASPIYRAIMRVTQSKSNEPVNVDGYLITPMKDIIATSQKHSRGMFKNKPSHRYHARKDYFITRIREEMERQSGGAETQGLARKVTLGQIMKLLIVPRVEAIIGYKEGNIAVLNAGLCDIVEATSKRQLQRGYKILKIKNCIKRIASYEKEIKELELLEKVTKDSEQKEIIERIIKQRRLYKLILEGRLEETKRIEVDSVSTDAVSMSQHDKANKANMSTIIRGFKIAAKVAIGKYLSKYLYEEVAHQAKTPDIVQYVPGKAKKIKKEVVDTITETVQGMDKTSVEKITLEDIYSQGSGFLTYHAYGGRQIEDRTEFFRGLAFKLEGKLCAGSDGKGFDPTVLTGMQLQQTLDKDTKIVSIIQEILQDKLKKQISADEISDMILNGKITGINIWRSTKQNGIPSGWLDASEVVPEMIESGSHEVTKLVTRVIEKVIPTSGKCVIDHGDLYEYMTSKKNPLIVALESLIGASGLADFSELLRRTMSQEAINERQPERLNYVAELNRRKREERKSLGKKPLILKGTSGKTQVKKRRTIKGFQRTNKERFRDYTYVCEEMKIASRREKQEGEDVTVFKGFTGTAEGDKGSGYDEDLIGVNDKKIKDER